MNKSNNLSETTKFWIFAVIAVIIIIGIINNVSDNDDKSDSVSSTVKYSSSNYSPYSKDAPKPPVNRELPMSKATAERLSGTGYHGCRPNSPAENNELRAAQAVCSSCGYHTTNGDHSLCNYCVWLFNHGQLPEKTASSTTTKDTEYSSKSRSSNSSAGKNNDLYDVHDYSDPEEFYYYHYDDFIDYEDAEDYYYDND